MNNNIYIWFGKYINKILAHFNLQLQRKNKRKRKNYFIEQGYMRNKKTSLPDAPTINAIVIGPKGKPVLYKYFKNENNQLVRGFFESDYSKINFHKAEIIENHIDQLEIIQMLLDVRLSKLYNNIFRSELFKNTNKDNEHLYFRLSKLIKKEYMTHNFLRKLERRKLIPEKAISFKEIMVEKSATRIIGCPDYAWEIDKKDVAYKFADAIGVRRPISDGITYSLANIKTQKGPVVVKPTKATGSLGVYLVFSHDKILSAREGVYLKSWEELIKDASSKLKAGLSGKNLLRKDEWMIEELILSEPDSTYPASDLKFYCFYGEVLFVSESNPTYRKKFCYWDSKMNLVNTGRYGKKFFDKGKGFEQEDLKIVACMSMEIPSPFIRFDMLKSYDGLVFCEATPRPGNFQLFSEEYDRLMGTEYRKAENRILQDLLNGKKFEAFTRLIKV